MKNAFLCFIFLVRSGLFGQSIPYGQEFRVNTSTDFFQLDPRVVALSGGGFVVCWENPDHNGSYWDVHAQVFDEHGEKMNGEFRVNTYEKDDQSNPTVAALAGGGFVVCWDSYGQDSSGSEIYGQVFDESGKKMNDEFRINSHTDYGQYHPSVAAFADGGFVVSWSCEMQDGTLDVHGQIFDGSGEKKNDEFQVNTYTNSDQRNSSVTALAGKGFVVCWESWEQDGSSNGVYAQKFDESGMKEKDEFRVNTYTASNQESPSIAALSGGGYVVCWDSDGQDGSDHGIYGQVFNDFGEKKSAEFQVNTQWDDFQSCPNVAALAGGGFIVCWISWRQEYLGYDVHGQVFDEFVEKKYGEFRVNGHTNTGQPNPTIAPSAGGGFIVCWDSWAQNFSGDGVYAKCFPSSPLCHILKPSFLIGPARDSILRTANTSLVWRQASDQPVCYPCELHYDIFIDDNPGFASPEIIGLDQDTTLVLNDLRPGQHCFWKVLSKNIAGDSLWSLNTKSFFVIYDGTGIEKDEMKSPEQFILHPNYPNPFNPETSIRFDLPETGFVVISVYDVNGRLIRVVFSEQRTAGSYSVKWDGLDKVGNAVPSGIYVCRMEVRSSDGRRFLQSVKMGLVR